MSRTSAGPPSSFSSGGDFSTMRTLVRPALTHSSVTGSAVPPLWCWNTSMACHGRPMRWATQARAVAARQALPRVVETNAAGMDPIVLA